MTGSERLRLFCALRLPDGSTERLAAWADGELHLALAGKQARFVPAANLHLTLAFLGSRPTGDLSGIAAALRSACLEAGDLRVRLRRYRETRSVGMLELDDEDGLASALAARLHGALEELGLYRPEARPWLPHVTVVRFSVRSRPEVPRPEMPRPEIPRPEIPQLGWIALSDAAVYMSRLRPGGARYDVLEVVPLGG